MNLNKNTNYDDDNNKVLKIFEVLDLMDSEDMAQNVADLSKKCRNQFNLQVILTS